MFRKLFCIALVVTSASPIFAWSECGHHVIAVIAYELLSPEQQQNVQRLLKAHPRFSKDFKVPDGTTDESHWLIGRAGYWPDVVQGLQPWNRPNWHYQLGATDVIGKVTKVPAFPVGLQADADLDTPDLYFVQAIELCRKIIADENESDSNKAVAICWLCHLVADSHQPCHAGSLYVEKVFPEGDRFANSIPVKQGSNLHALWDGLLGQRYDAGDIRRRIGEIKNEAFFLSVTGFDPRFNILDPERWLDESREAARNYVYAPQVMEPLLVAMRSEGKVEISPINLSETYLENAGRIAQLRAIQSSARLAKVLSELK